jgi:hypothetical protein
MLKVKWQECVVLVPVLDDSGDHDAKISQGKFDEMMEAAELLQGRRIGFDPGCSRFGQSLLVVGGPPALCAAPGTPAYTSMENLRPRPPSLPAGPPPSQDDPPINTRVTDSEMNSSAPQMSLEEFRERPERTRAAPRPRANSWRHNE